jgi:Zn-dependent protease with chaperone function
MLATKACWSNVSAQIPVMTPREEKTSPVRSSASAVSAGWSDSCALAALGGCGVAGLAAALVGALSACVVFLDELERAPAGSLAFALLTLASLGASLRALFSFAHGQRLLRRVPFEALDGDLLAEVAASAAGARLYRSPGGRPIAFCFGLLRPRIVVSSGLLSRLRPEEQAAAVWHEAFHAHGREPLKCALARLAASTFWIPVFADLLARYLLAKELVADRVAVENTSRRALAGALCEVAGQRAPAVAVALSDSPPAASIASSTQPRRCRPCSGAAGSRSARAQHDGLGAAAELPRSARPCLLAALREAAASMSLHGPPGIALGLALNMLCGAAVVVVWRWLGRRRPAYHKP